MNPPQPTQQLPAGWVALWDETSKRYYYLEQATGRTQWEFPSQVSSSFNPVGEANSYHSNYSPQYPNNNNNPTAVGYPTQGYPAQQQGSPYSNSPVPNSQYPANPTDPNAQDRGLGNVFKGYGGVVAGGLIGLAAGKFLGNHHGHHHHQNEGYYPPPPSQGFGGFGQGFGGHHQHHHHSHFF
ncbi:hypothetical protein G6F56_011341 [Rhizopus delemar]|nr:hypothetical protein G6F56_011341 [Rhizopus delemar]